MHRGGPARVRLHVLRLFPPFGWMADVDRRHNHHHYHHHHSHHAIPPPPPWSPSSPPSWRHQQSAQTPTPFSPNYHTLSVDSHVPMYARTPAAPDDFGWCEGRNGRRVSLGAGSHSADGRGAHIHNQTRTNTHTHTCTHTHTRTLALPRHPSAGSIHRPWLGISYSA